MQCNCDDREISDRKNADSYNEIRSRIVYRLVSGLGVKRDIYFPVHSFIAHRVIDLSASYSRRLGITYRRRFSYLFYFANGLMLSLKTRPNGSGASAGT